MTAPLYPLSAGPAVISDDEVYRYVLNRRWDDRLPVMPWVCLNPSTADARTDDASVRRMRGFAEREGCGGICVLNAHALRARNPKRLAEHPKPDGPDNDRWLAGLAAGGVDAPVVAAWGAKLNPGRAAEVLALLAGVPVVCLGVTADGSPRHPLYLRGDAPMVPYATASRPPDVVPLPAVAR
jgi:hypothetical protein